MNDDKILLRDFFPYQLANLAQRVSTSLSRSYQEKFNLSIPQWRVLACLGERDSSTAKIIAEQSFMDKVKTSRAIKEMSAKGLLQKKQDGSDNRAYWLNLSPKGKKLYRAVVPYALAWEDDFLSGLNGAEYKHLSQMFAKLNEKLDAME